MFPSGINGATSVAKAGSDVLTLLRRSRDHVYSTRTPLYTLITTNYFDVFLCVFYVCGTAFSSKGWVSIPVRPWPSSLCFSSSDKSFSFAPVQFLRVFHHPPFPSSGKTTDSSQGKQKFYPLFCLRVGKTHFLCAINWAFIFSREISCPMAERIAQWEQSA